jgi:hypothetical protein
VVDLRDRVMGDAAEVVARGGAGVDGADGMIGHGGRVVHTADGVATGAHELLRATHRRCGGRPRWSTGSSKGSPRPRSTRSST